MEEQKIGFIQWVKEHKKELIIAGISVAAIIGIIIGIKNKDYILDLWESLKKSIDKTPIKEIPDVNKSVETVVQNSVSVVETVSRAEIIEFPARKAINATFDVSDHIRNLPDGCHASTEKIATALEHGYNLKPGQTWVDTYMKGIAIT